MRSRVATLLTIAMLAVGVGGTFAVASQSGGGGSSAAATQYHGNKHCANKKFARSHPNACRKGKGNVKGNRGSGKGKHNNKKSTSKKKSSKRNSPALAGRSTPHLAG